MEMAKMENNEIKNSKLIPRLRFPGFEGKWEYVNGNELFEPISNKNHNSDLPILALTQEQGAVPRDEINYKVIVSDRSVAGYKVVEVDDFIISLRSFQGGIEYSRYKGLCSPAYIVLRKKLKGISSDFYRIYFKSFNYIQALNKNLEGIRDGKMISYSQFSEIKLPKPSLPEQQKIASCLSELDNLIAAQGQKVDALKEKKKGLMQQLFPQPGETTPRLRFPGFEGEWVEKKLGEMAEFVNGMAFKPSDWIDKGLKIVRIQNLNDEKAPFNYCNPDIANENCLIDTGDLLFSWSGTPGTSFGAFIWNRGKAVLNQHIFIVYPLNCVKLFLKSVFDASMDIIIEHAHGGAGLRHITKSDLESIKAFFPSSLSEQERIASCLSSLDDLIAAESAKVEALKDHKKGLMQQLFPQPAK